MYVRVMSVGLDLEFLGGAFQQEKKSLKRQTEKDRALLIKASLDMALVKEHPDDVKVAGLLKYGAVKSEYQSLHKRILRCSSP